MRALGRLDGRQGVPALLEALSDSRARYAVYALRSALSDLPPHQVLTVMRGVPMGKVTVAKEAVRLAGEFGGVASLAWFAELDRQDLHRDVRGAMLRALWDHLEEVEAWSILDASVSSPDPGVVIGLARIQIDRASVAARERVANLLRRLLDHSEPSVRVAVLNRLVSQPVPDVKRLLLAALLRKFASAVPDERSGGLRAALAAASDADADAFVSTVKSLMSRKRELSAVLTEFARLTRPLGPRLVEVRSVVLAAIESDPSLALLQIRLAVARFAAEHFAHWTQKLVDSGRWHAGTQTAVLEALIESAQPVEDLERGESVWAASPDPASHWLALRVLFHTASIQGWSEPRRDRLRGYQSDSSPMIADEAALTFPPAINATESS